MIAERLSDVRLDEIEIRGAITVDHTPYGLFPRRLPEWARAQIPDAFMVQTSAESAGIRLAFRTTATVIELDVRARRMTPDAESPLPPSTYELTSGREVVGRSHAAAGSRYVFSFDRPEGMVIDGPASTVRFTGLDGDALDLELWLPYTDAVEVLALRADAPVERPRDAQRTRWLHHGSSISHGYRADFTTGTWPVVAALAAGADLTNVAFSGNAMLDPFTARTMRDAAADLISLKVGINLVNGDVMRRRAFLPAVHGFIDTIRDGHPDTPIVVVSPIWCEPAERAAGPTIQDPTKAFEWSVAGGTRDEVAQGKLSLASIREDLREIVATRAVADPELRYVDGLDLYGPDAAARMPLPDNLHPGPDAQRHIGERFAELVLTPFTNHTT
ncbi:GDSL-type esterase/lipase family protein [Agromyces sp. SYSU K20354]|uniref:GDSL-type esterase/lipase family protein n=1 Tax=Agromyces cavernae TaxID=2898659 RepID=UPI001E52314D|nr:GDSL-type esterase/lipase family protein [Agromyces cavernae]MCD2443222.1 GDSL-type esterase/lipase family protein [Agromyces cavernae]